MTKPDPLELRGLQLTANKLNKQHPPPAYWTRWIVQEDGLGGGIIITTCPFQAIMRMENGRFRPYRKFCEFDEYDTPEEVWYKTNANTCKNNDHI